jgi:hypothetical protein
MVLTKWWQSNQTFWQARVYEAGKDLKHAKKSLILPPLHCSTE